jgi:hypothetical protein
MVEGNRNELELFNLECYGGVAVAYRRVDLALQAFRLYRRL